MAQGFTRFRKLQVGKQTVIETAVAATRVLPYRSLIVYNPNRTDPDIDVGSLDPIIAPYMVAPEVTLPGAAGPLTFNDLAIRLSAAIKGGVSPTGSAGAGYTWTFTAASLTADSFDYYSVQTGDDTSDSAGAGTNGFGAVINQFSQTMEEGLGPWTVSDDWIMAGATYGNRTGGLNVDANPKFVFGADTAFYLNSVAGAIGATQILAAVRGATLTVNNNLDQKRFADGSNTRFQLSAFGRGLREITLELVLEKTTQTIAELVTFDDTPTPNRYIKIATNSLELAGTVTTCYAEFYLPMRLYEVSDGEIENNANITLTYRGFYDTTLGYAFKAIVLNSLSTLP
jgi:hypothetical protein